jgi:hypothetical protein
LGGTELRNNQLSLLDYYGIITLLQTANGRELSGLAVLQNQPAMEKAVDCKTPLD